MQSYLSLLSKEAWKQNKLGPVWIYQLREYRCATKMSNLMPLEQDCYIYLPALKNKNYCL